MSGWIKLHRIIQDNHLWLSEPFTRSQAWVDLLLLANHAPGFYYVRGNRIDIKRGELVRSEENLALRWKWSRNKLRGFLKTLKNEQQIEQQNSNIINRIIILNYDFYQQDEQQTEQQKDSRKTAERQQKDTNNKKENKKKKKEREAHTNFLSLELSEEGIQIAEDAKIPDWHIPTCWAKFKIVKESTTDWLADWKVWVLNEKVPKQSKKENDGVVALTGEELKISHLGSAAWRRKRDMTLNKEQITLLKEYEEINGVVWWDNLRQFKEGRK